MPFCGKCTAFFRNDPGAAPVFSGSGGADPAEYLRRYSGRCPLVHMKDFVRDGAVTLVALGDGELDVGAAAAQAAESGAEWLVAEQDDHHFGSPMENMKKSIDCLKKL